MFPITLTDTTEQLQFSRFERIPAVSMNAFQNRIHLLFFLFPLNRYTPLPFGLLASHTTSHHARSSNQFIGVSIFAGVSIGINVFQIRIQFRKIIRKVFTGVCLEIAGV